MGQVKRLQFLEPECGVQRERDAPEPRIGSWPPGCKRSVHCVVSNDEQAHVEPAQHSDKQRGDAKTCSAEALEEQAVDMETCPGGDDRSCEENPERCLAPHF